MNKIEGRVAWRFGDHFDVDLIIGVQNISEKDMDRLVEVCMKDFDPDFAREVKQGDFLLAGKNFGYGHPHPQVMKVMKHLGIQAVIAKSFARVFFKNEIAAGLVLLPCPDLPDHFERWERVEADLDRWAIIFPSQNKTLSLGIIPPVEIEIIKAGGIAPYFKKRLVN